jgi:hypothetical protein
MNNLQKIAMLISGYKPYEDFTSARDDGYYKKKKEDEKLAYVMTVANMGDGVEPVSMREALKVIEFLDKDFSGTDERFHAFQEL